MKWRAIVIGAVMVLICVPAVSTASVGMAWVQHYEGPTDPREPGVAIALDITGNVYVAGASDNGVSGNDFITLSYTPKGAERWWVRYNGDADADDAARDLAIDQSGNICVTGYSRNGSSKYEAATVQYSSVGAFRWSQRYDGLSYRATMPTMILTDPDDNVVVCGQGADGYFTVEYTQNGAFRWVQTADVTDDFPFGPSMAVNDAGNVYVAGVWGTPHGTPARIVAYNALGEFLWDNTSQCGLWDCIFTSIQVAADGHLFVTGFGYESNVATFRWSNTGWPEWFQQYENPDDWDMGIKLELDEAGDVYVFGYVYGGSPTEGGSSYDCLTWKLNAEGETYWTQRYEGPGNTLDWPLDMCLDGDGSVYTFAYSHVLAGSYDWIIKKYSTNGLPLWEYRFDGSGNDSIGVWRDLKGALTVDPAGDVYAAGYTYSQATGLMLTTLKIEASCHCPYQCDAEPDGFATALDLAAIIDALFAGATNPQDAGCPIPRYDFDCDGFTTAIDLARFIDHLFAGQTMPCDPCLSP